MQRPASATGKGKPRTSEEEENMESQTPATESKMNLPRFLLSLLIKPKQAFTQLDQTGRPHFLWAAGAMLVVIWLGAFLTLPVTQREAAKAFDAMDQSYAGLTEEQLSMQREFATSPVLLVAGAGITETIAYPILWLSAAGLLYLLSLAFGGQAHFKSMFTMTVWVSVVEVLGRIVRIVGTVGMNRTVQSGFAYLVATDNPADLTPLSAALAPILSKITIFDIWYLVLIGIGVVVCAKVTRAKGAAITVLYFVLSLIPPVAAAAAGAAVSSMFLG
jgi:hypothetical protein